ncbi:MAG: S9 family peptidase, partial [Gemmatimonadaceae bacterium]|nr:S9 family peptidase [Gloeobacterales cyanobacterium ES-bin-141]
MTSIQQQTVPPVAQPIPRQDVIHGETRTDSYFWLRDKANPKVIEYLEAENRYTETLMRQTEKLQADLYKELVGRIKQTDLTVPERQNGYYYYSRTEEGKQYTIYCRKKGDLSAPEEILVDQNALAEKSAYFRVGAYRVSPNQRYLAYSVDTDGSEIYTIYLKDLQNGELMADRITNAYGYALDWANDDRTLFYVTQDSAKRPYRVYRHTLGSTQADGLLFEEKDELFFVFLEKTRSKTYLLIGSESKITSEVRYLSADTPTGEFEVFHPRKPGVKYSVDHRADKFYILTDEDAKNSKLMEVSVSSPARQNWQEIIAHQNTIKLDGIDLFKDHLVVYEREDGLKNIRIVHLADSKVHRVSFPEPVYTFVPNRNPEFDTSTLRFTYDSLVTPDAVTDYDMNARTNEVKKREEVKGYDPSLYQSERTHATAPDGTRVPISLVYKKGIARDGSNPLYLYAYGSYGASMDPSFAANRLSLLDRGFIFAIAHIRGGGEMGKAWYEDGKLLKKKNTFTDYIASAEHLIAQKYTSAGKLVASGGSAGGLLMGAVVNMRPDLFKAVVAKVPFVDVINTMLDPSIPLTVTEYEEWGNPSD